MSKSYITTKTLAEIKRLNQEGKNDAEVADLLGMPVSTVRWWRTRQGLPKVKGYHRGVKQYAVHDGKTEELVALGTAKECAAALGIDLGSFRKSMFEAKRGAYKKYSFCEVEHDVDDCCQS